MKKTIYATVTVGAALLGLNPALAQTYPAQPIKLVVPFAPGGGADIPARLIAKKMTDDWKQPVIVENRPGATGTIGENYVAKAAPDGYTLLIGTPSSHTMGPHLLKTLPYDPIKDFKPVTMFGVVRHLLVVNPSLPVHSVNELIALAKSKPGSLNYASSGNGSSVHLSTETFSGMAGISMNQIPYSGVSPALASVVSGQVQLMFAPAAIALQQIKAGALRPLAALTTERFSELPDVPTIAQAGLPDYKSMAWLGLLAPANTPDAVVQKLQTEIARIMKMKDVQDTMNGMSIDATSTSSGEFDDLIKTEYAKYGALIKQLGLAP